MTDQPNPKKRKVVQPCSRCGSKDKVKYQANPFALEIYGDRKQSFLCENCVAVLADDI